MNRTLLSLCGLLAAAAGATPPSVVIPLFFSEVAQQAELIVVGTVTGSTCRHAGGGATIHTYVTLGDLVVHKGTAPATLILQFDGGQVGDDRLWVPGMPSLLRGQRYLLYIAKNGTSASPIVGFDQGAFSVEATGGREILRNLKGLELIGIRDDRFEFAAKPEPTVPARTPGPAVVAGTAIVTPAAGNQTPVPPAKAKPQSDRATPAHQRDASPIVTPPSQDRGERTSVETLVTASLRVR